MWEGGLASAGPPCESLFEDMHLSATSTAAVVSTELWPTTLTSPERSDTRSELNSLGSGKSQRVQALSRDKQVLAEKMPDRAAEDKEELADVIAGLNARFKTRFEVLRSDGSEEGQMSTGTAARQDQSRTQTSPVQQEEGMDLCKLLYAAQRSEKASSSERDSMKQNLAAMEANHAAEVRELKSKLAASEEKVRALSMQADAIAASAKQDATGAGDGNQSVRPQMGAAQEEGSCKTGNLQKLLEQEGSHGILSGPRLAYAHGFRRKIRSPPRSWVVKKAVSSESGKHDDDSLFCLTGAESQVESLCVGDLADFADFDDTFFEQDLEAENAELRSTIGQMKEQLRAVNAKYSGLLEASSAEMADNAAKMAAMKQQAREAQDALEEKCSHYKAKADVLQRQLATANHHRFSLEEERAKLREQCGEVAALQEELRRAKEENKQKSIPAAAAAASSPGASGSLAELLSRLRCPSRQGACTWRGLRPAPFQDVAWRLVTAIQGLPVVLCDAYDLTILDASKSACSLWGSVALLGESILSLANSPCRACWLRQSFEAGQAAKNSAAADIPGFVLREFGCEEFTAKDGQTFDFIIVAASLPSEQVGKQGPWLVIFQPQSTLGGSVLSCQSQWSPSRASSVVTSEGGLARDDVERLEVERQDSGGTEISDVVADDSASNCHRLSERCWASEQSS